MTSSINALMSEGSAGDRILRVSRSQIEFTAFTLWVAVTFVQFDRDELLLYPLALYFVIRAWQQRDAVLRLMAQSWVIMLYPLWCLMSPIWAVAPEEAFKHGIYMALTSVICYHVILVLTPRQILYAVLIATGFIGVLNLILGMATGNMQTVVFVHKNLMGSNMVMLWAAALTTSLDKKSPRAVRLIAVVLALIALFLIAHSNSATAVLVGFGAGFIIVTGASLLQGGLFRPSRLAIACLAIALSLGATSQVINIYKGDPVEKVLDQFGKDRTLTGRTVLWHYAEREIRDHPALGVGYEGFWRYDDSPLVRGIYDDFHKSRYARFQFHNSFYEVAVHQGLIGLGVLVLAVLWTMRNVIGAAFSVGEMPQIFLLSISAIVIIRAFTESDFMRPFILLQMLFWMGALIAVQEKLSRQNMTGSNNNLGRSNCGGDYRHSRRENH